MRTALKLSPGRSPSGSVCMFSIPIVWRPACPVRRTPPKTGIGSPAADNPIRRLKNGTRSRLGSSESGSLMPIWKAAGLVGGIEQQRRFDPPLDVHPAIGVAVPTGLQLLLALGPGGREWLHLQ